MISQATSGLLSKHFDDVVVVHSQGLASVQVPDPFPVEQESETIDGHLESLGISGFQFPHLDARIHPDMNLFRALTNGSEIHQLLSPTNSILPSIGEGSGVGAGTLSHDTSGVYQSLQWK